MAFDIDIKFELLNHTDEVLQLFDQAVNVSLERCGLQAESYAVDLVPVGTPESTGIEGYAGGTLKQSITHKVDTAEKAVYIGTNIDYGIYVELGTGIYAEGGGGRPTPWVWQDMNGKWHHTRGQEPQPFLRPAINNHKQTYRNIIEDELKNSGAGTIK